MDVDVKKLTSELEAAEKDANMDLRDVHPNVYSAWTSRIEDGKRNAERLSKAYRKLTMDNGVAIFLLGDPKKVAEFAEIVAEEELGIIVDAARTYRTIAEKVEPLLAAGGRQLMAQHVAIIADALKDLADAVDMEMYLQGGDLPILPDLDATTDYVRNLARGAAGDVLNVAYLSRAYADEVRKSRYTGGVISTIIVGATPEEVPGIGGSFGRVGATLTLKPDHKIDKNKVLGQFNKVKETLKREKAEKAENEAQR